MSSRGRASSLAAIWRNGTYLAALSRGRVGGHSVKTSAKSLHAIRRSDRNWAGLWTDLVIEQVMMRAVKSRGGLTHGRGLTDSVRLVWIKSMHQCASLTAAPTALTETEHNGNNIVHVELGKSRINRDNEDLNKLIEFLDQHNPFNQSDDRLCSISSGVIASDEDEINCDQAEKVGEHFYSVPVKWSSCTMNNQWHVVPRHVQLH